ncbi:uncharacterized protein LOC143020931 isoform X2 [Oratosquilla oratoria]
MAPKVIIDTDPGLDDAIAIFMALEAHKRGEIEVIGLTTVHGNSGIENVTKNAVFLLETVNMTKIPIYKGASDSLVQKWVFEEEPFHGHDGFGDSNVVPNSTPVDIVQPQHAVFALVDIVNRHPNEIYLAALGPLTNIALAIKMDPNFTSKLAGIYGMGGNTTGQGNITSSAEFNFHCDPEAAYVVLEETQQQLKIVPWETCIHKMKLPYSFREELGRINSPVAEIMNKGEQIMISKRSYGIYITCDQITMAWLLHDLKKIGCDTEKQDKEDFVKTTTEMFATVELHGKMTRGQMVVDHTGMKKRTPNLLILAEGNMELFKQYLRMAFGGPF